MNIIIFGATGRTGKELLNQSLEQGHKVTAYARNPENISLNHPQLSVIQGDVLNLSEVEQAISGIDAVICALGMPNILDRSQLRSKGTRHIIAAMKKEGVERLICLSGLGAGDSRQLLPAHYRYLIVPLFMRSLLKDHDEQERMIMKSGLNWSIARPGNLTDKERTGKYLHGLSIEGLPASLKTSRADTADFMLSLLTNDRYLHQSPWVLS